MIFLERGGYDFDVIFIYITLAVCINPCEILQSISDLENETNNGLQNEDLIVWMRAAALPNFRQIMIV